MRAFGTSFSRARVDDILPLVRTLTASDRDVQVRFDPAGVATVEAFAEAERMCCAGLSWEVDPATSTLRISGTREQVLELARLFAT